MTHVILTVYRTDLPVARAHWTARYIATADGLPKILEQLARYTDPIYRWYVTTISR